MKQGVYDRLVTEKKSGRKSFAVLVDPDRGQARVIEHLVSLAVSAKVDYFFVGGSLVVTNTVHECIRQIKASCDIPVVLFPGSPSQVSPHADALFYLSLISGRNPELLIGQHVLSATQIKASGLEIMPTGYLVIDGGAPTSVSYISNAAPIPADKDDIAMCTAMAGEMLGLKVMYMDAGSGARNPVSESMIARVSEHTSCPLIVGGGITTADKAAADCRAGADVVVVGNAIEKSPSLISEIAAAVHGGGE